MVAALTPFTACQGTNREFDSSGGKSGSQGGSPELAGGAGDEGPAAGGDDAGAHGGGGPRQAGRGGADGGEGGKEPGPGPDAAGAGGGGDEIDPVDPCLGVACNTPPASSCSSPNEYQSYDGLGSCAEGVCSYAEHHIPCTCQSGMCTTDPCLAVKCDTPPATQCTDPDTLTTYAVSGTCSAGSCSYAPTSKICEFGCANGACKPDPCAAVTCNMPPASKCKNAGTKTTYASSGTCDDGDCSYSATDTDCASNQACTGKGVCSVCKSDASCGASCTACAGATPKCKDQTTTSKCVECVSSSDCGAAKPVCNTTTNVCEQRSCASVAKTCGPRNDQSCCGTNPVIGGTFNRSNDSSYPATISTFSLDTYEITVGRFRKFVAAYSKTMTAAGAGKNPSNPSDTGWDTGWNASLPADAGALQTALKCDSTRQTWTDAAGSDAAESRPINCIDWFEAEAFCIWDGGRLPTEAEWNFAAAGGKAQRTYPWGTNAPDCTYANFKGSAGDYCVAPGTGGLNRVGSESNRGDGPFGHADMAGNVYEWVQDWSASDYVNPCNDCARLVPPVVIGGPDIRVFRGGNYASNAASLATTARGSSTPSYREAGVGARCARAQ